MKISRSTLDKAADEQIITPEQANALYQFIKNQPDQQASFNFTNVLYYFGGLIAIGAMTLFMNLGWENFGPWGIFFLCVIYAMIGLWLTALFDKKNYKIPAGICATFVIALTPLAVYAVQKALGLWPIEDSHYRGFHAIIHWHWIFMEFATLIVGLILAWIYRYPFMVMPIAVTLWYMSMDIADLIMGDTVDFEFNALISMYFGLIVTLIAFWVDVRSRHTVDYAFWLYLFGVITFWGGMTAQSSDSELSKFFYLCINLFMIGIGVILVRRIFVVLGGIGCCIYLGHLAWQVFQNSMLFPIALTLIGLIIIYLGTLWQKHEVTLTQKAQALLPKPIQELLKSRE
ncbi:membrane protein [Legionella beliardensis]|uniref:Membrane protein n=1 Tax=Legionella beliardensis TaxID=91822 RepID=A0A378I0I1_9GAMM|nr:DUF2157 domain-containing protein [Legionella beliardensis]STX28697.1 membrane protein [Legionella beliardensis]